MENQQNAPPEIRKVIDFLRGSSSGLKNRVGVLNGSRREYFKGKSAVKALLSPAYQKLKNVPQVPDEASAALLLQSMLQFAFYLKVSRGNPSGTSSSSPKAIQIIQMQDFQPDAYYAWFYEGSQWKTYLGGAGLVGVVLAGVMFPLWPVQLRIGVWYLSMGGFGVIGLFIAMAIFRLIFYIITVVTASPGIWIFPKLFADVGFIDSFIPGWDWDIPPPKKVKKKKGEKESGDEKKKKRKQVEGATPSPAPTPAPTARIEEVSDQEE